MKPKSPPASVYVIFCEFGLHSVWEHRARGLASGWKAVRYVLPRPAPALTRLERNVRVMLRNALAMRKRATNEAGCNWAAAEAAAYRAVLMLFAPTRRATRRNRRTK